MAHSGANAIAAGGGGGPVGIAGNRVRGSRGGKVMEFVTTFIDKDGYVMAFRVKASSEEDAWEIGRDRA